MIMQTVVMKFGGTSVADAPAIARVISIVRSRAGQLGATPVVVVSAMSGVTDRLLGLASAAARREETSAALDELWARHLDATAALVSAGRRDALVASLRAHLDDLRSLLKATSILRAATPAALDAIASTGELLSSQLVAAAFADAGVPATWIDARRAMVTDNRHTAAAPLMDATRTAVAREMRPALAAGNAVVVGGFVGATPDEVTTTL